MVFLMYDEDYLKAPELGSLLAILFKSSWPS